MRFLLAGQTSESWLWSVSNTNRGLLLRFLTRLRDAAPSAGSEKTPHPVDEVILAE